MQGTGQEPHNVREGAPSGPDDLKHGVRGGRLPLDLDRQNAKQQYLDGRTSSIPGQDSTSWTLSHCQASVSSATALLLTEHSTLEQRGAPERSRHAVLVCNIATLKQRRRPCPVTNNVHGNQARADGAASCQQCKDVLRSRDQPPLQEQLMGRQRSGSITLPVLKCSELYSC